MPPRMPQIQKAAMKSLRYPSRFRKDAYAGVKQNGVLGMRTLVSRDQSSKMQRIRVLRITDGDIRLEMHVNKAYSMIPKISRTNDTVSAFPRLSSRY